MPSWLPKGRTKKKKKSFSVQILVLGRLGGWLPSRWLPPRLLGALRAVAMDSKATVPPLLRAASGSAADFNGDGIIDNGDISAFVAAFLAGC